MSKCPTMMCLADQKKKKILINIFLRYSSHKRSKVSILSQTENGTWSEFRLKTPSLTKLDFTHNIYTWWLPSQSWSEFQWNNFNEVPTFFLPCSELELYTFTLTSLLAKPWPSYWDESGSSGKLRREGQPFCRWGHRAQAVVLGGWGLTAALTFGSVVQFG